MKSKYLVTLLSAATLLAAGSVFADEDYKHINKQNLSKRPYQQVPAESANKKENFEGATLINENAEVDGKHKQMRLNMLGKRPYAEKNTD
ncbi:MAG: hypothetical protein Q8S46_00070 [Methylotenera sp.]|nr:hypothetical protein [Methylotenera sp.]MDO9233474.1 hypothetical protein [Methylotenera sp.]MDO9389127.1 hypothetical protein [Methylotenera sp.]MDP1596974.1 hypothetical protein [Methylotenera sp.]MDP1754993.1 hypothetical protein [Methylotenera sp.]